MPRLRQNRGGAGQLGAGRLEGRQPGPARLATGQLRTPRFRAMLTALMLLVGSVVLPEAGQAQEAQETREAREEAADSAQQAQGIDAASGKLAGGIRVPENSRNTAEAGRGIGAVVVVTRSVKLSPAN